MGSDGVSLQSHGSYLFALEHFGNNGCEKVIRRLKYTPKLAAHGDGVLRGH